MPRWKKRKLPDIAKGERAEGGPGWNLKYKKEFVEQTRKLMDMGCTQSEIANFLGVDPSTLQQWSVKYPEYRKALSIDGTRANERVEMSLFNQAVGYWVHEEEIKVIEGKVTRVIVRKFYPPNVAASIYWTKVKMRWRDDAQDELPGQEGEKTIEGQTVPNETTRQLARRVALVLYQGGKKSA
jgi:hypothetical protein